MTKPGGGAEFREALGAAFGDAAVALSLLSGEVIHEVTHTLNFLRLFLDEQAGDADGEIIRFAKAEQERMQRMVRQLRKIKLPAPAREDVALAEVVRQSIERVQDAVTQRGLTIDAHLPAAAINDDEECLLSALRNVLLDIVERAPAGSSITVAGTEAAQLPLQLEFSAEGEALADPNVTALNWQQEGPSVTPEFRLVLAHRLLRHLGWSMSYERRAQRNVIRLTAPMPMSPSI